MRTILLVCTLFFACSAYAQTGIFYDHTYRGEGITVFEGEDLSGDVTRTVYLYTYGLETCETSVEFTEQTLEVEATAVCPNSIIWPHLPLCQPVIEVNSITINVPQLVETCNLDGQRWFVGSDEVDEFGDSIGKMYITHGIDFPNCVPSGLPFEEDVEVCGDVIEVGDYILRPTKEGGFEMWIESDDKSDPAFNQRYNFADQLR